MSISPQEISPDKDMEFLTIKSEDNSKSSSNEKLATIEVIEINEINEIILNNEVPKYSNDEGTKEELKNEDNSRNASAKKNKSLGHVDIKKDGKIVAKRKGQIYEKIESIREKLNKRLADALEISIEEFKSRPNPIGDLESLLKRNLKTFSYKSTAGSSDGLNVKINQDAFFAFPNFAGKRDMHLFGVCDGHGSQGHLVSNYVKQTLPSLHFHLRIRNT